MALSNEACEGEAPAGRSKARPEHRPPASVEWVGSWCFHPGIPFMLSGGRRRRSGRSDESLPPSFAPGPPVRHVQLSWSGRRYAI